MNSLSKPYRKEEQEDLVLT